MLSIPVPRPSDGDGEIPQPDIQKGYHARICFVNATWPHEGNVSDNLTPDHHQYVHVAVGCNTNTALSV